MADRSTDRILFSLETLGLSASPRNEMCKKFPNMRPAGLKGRSGGRIVTTSCTVVSIPNFYIPARGAWP
jgi:hypothetical protein